MKLRITVTCVAALAVMFIVPASADIIGMTGSGSNDTSSNPADTPGAIFSDLGTGNNVYNCCSGWTVAGTGTLGTSFTAANLFNSGAGGTLSQIDLGVGYVTGTNAFYASIWTDVGNAPGVQVGGARWDNLSSSVNFGNCCGLVTISGISGVTLNASTNYFMILGPESLSATTWEAWNLNSTGANGLDLFSTDGGKTWNSNGTQSLGAFDVIVGGAGVPEPSTFLLIGTGLLGVLAVRRKITR